MAQKPALSKGKGCLRIVPVTALNWTGWNAGQARSIEKNSVHLNQITLMQGGDYT